MVNLAVEVTAVSGLMVIYLLLVAATTASIIMVVFVSGVLKLVLFSLVDVVKLVII